mmetsp:Transcript_44758/g.81053  ORF Transcript_44758/g.81053 Transcript_44758/m.81053 type:complete len:175 (-) Transcript_44758:13-537(-)
MAVMSSGPSIDGAPSEQDGRAALQEDISRRYREKYLLALHKRQVRLYESAWEECIRREQLSQTSKQPDQREQHTVPAYADVGFSVKYDTFPGQDLCLAGTCPELGEWDVSRSAGMAWSEGNVWLAKVTLPRDIKVEYKYVVRLGGLGEIWEPGNNHFFEVNESSRLRGDQWGAG